MGLTAIKTIINRTNKLFEISKREDPNDSVSVLPNASVTNEEEYNKKIIGIIYTDSKKTTHIRQNGDKVRYFKSGWETPSKAIPGDSQIDGDWTLIIENSYPTLKK